MSSDQFWWPEDAVWPGAARTRPEESRDLGAPYFWRLQQVEYRHLTANLEELKTRVAQVEATLSRGVLLLVANLAAVLATLVAGYLGG